MVERLSVVGLSLQSELSHYIFAIVCAEIPSYADFKRVGVVILAYIIPTGAGDYFYQSFRLLENIYGSVVRLIVQK